jgi:hypothetical protein
MTERIKPYTTNQETWKSIYQKQLQIPMNQRNYDWGNDELQKFVQDTVKLFEEGKYVEKMGSIINLNHSNSNFIYDGQQRILTTALELYVLSKLCPKLTSKIIELLTVDTEIDVLSEQQLILKTETNATLVPKIYCINPFDRIALINIFNNRCEYYIDYIEYSNEENNTKEDITDSFENEQNDDDDYYYKCKICKTTCCRKTDFIRHLEKSHKFKKLQDDSKLYNACEFLYTFLLNKKYDEKNYIDLYKFILNDIDIQYYDCNDPVYVSRIFDWENNRGKNVETLDLIKNPILVKIPDNKKMEVYEKWEELKNRQNKIYKNNFGQKIFDVAIQLYNNKIERTIDIERLFYPIINATDTYTELQNFFKIVEELHIIIQSISNDKYGRLINNTPRVCLNWEAYMWVFLPIFYKKKSIDSNLIKLFTKWYYRNMGFDTRTFNNLCYSNEFIKITNEYLKNEDYDYYASILTCLQKNKDKKIDDNDYENNLKRMTYKSTNATHILLFTETCINTDTHVVQLDFTLEHIFPQKNKDKLTDLSLINNLGNITLLEYKNSENGHKGNSALGSKDYSIKKQQYKDSSSKITRLIADTYNEFNETEILNRCGQLATILNKYTNY